MMSALLSPLAANTILYCRAWQDTVAFYRDRLQLPVTHANDWFVEFKLAAHSYLSVADERRATIKSAGGAGLTITLQVESAEETHRHFQHRGIECGPLKDHAWGAKVFYLFDPEGHRIEIWSPVIS